MAKVTITCIVYPLCITLICALIDFIYLKKGKATKEQLKQNLIIRAIAAYSAALLIWIPCATLIWLNK